MENTGAIDRGRRLDLGDRSGGGIEPPSEYRAAAAVAGASAERLGRAYRAPAGRAGRPQGAHTERHRRRWLGRTEPTFGLLSSARAGS